MENIKKMRRLVAKEEYFIITGDFLESIILSHLQFLTERSYDYDKFIEEEISHLENPDEQNIEKKHGWFFKKSSDLYNELFQAYSERTIRQKLNSLVEKGFIQKRQNPYNSWDKSFQYRVNLTFLQQKLYENGLPFDGYALPVDRSGKICHSDGENCHSNGEICHSNGKICHSDGENFHFSILNNNINNNINNNTIKESEEIYNYYEKNNKGSDILSAKRDAISYIQNLLKIHSPEELKACIDNYVRYRKANNRLDEKFIKAPHNFFNPNEQYFTNFFPQNFNFSKKIDEPDFFHKKQKCPICNNTKFVPIEKYIPDLETYSFINVYCSCVEQNNLNFKTIKDFDLSQYQKDEKGRYVLIKREALNGKNSSNKHFQ